MPEEERRITNFTIESSLFERMFPSKEIDDKWHQQFLQCGASVHTKKYMDTFRKDAKKSGNAIEEMGIRTWRFDDDVAHCPFATRKQREAVATVARTFMPCVCNCTATRTPADGNIILVERNASVGNGVKRHISNFNELHEGLKAEFGHRVRLVRNENLTPCEQWCAAHNAAVYIGQHGAGLVNALFLRPRSALIEIGEIHHIPPDGRMSALQDDLKRDMPLDHGSRPNYHCLSGMAGAFYRGVGQRGDAGPVDVSATVAVVHSALRLVGDKRADVETMMRWPLERETDIRNCHREDPNLMTGINGKGGPYVRLAPCVPKENTAQQDWINEMREKFGIDSRVQKGSFPWARRDLTKAVAQQARPADPAPAGALIVAPQNLTSVWMIPHPISPRTVTTTAGPPKVTPVSAALRYRAIRQIADDVVSRTASGDVSNGVAVSHMNVGAIEFANSIGNKGHSLLNGLVVAAATRRAAVMQPAKVGETLPTFLHVRKWLANSSSVKVNTALVNTRFCGTCGTCASALGADPQGDIGCHIIDSVKPSNVAVGWTCAQHAGALASGLGVNSNATMASFFSMGVSVAFGVMFDAAIEFSDEVSSSVARSLSAVRDKEHRGIWIAVHLRIASPEDSRLLPAIGLLLEEHRGPLHKSCSVLLATDSRKEEQKLAKFATQLNISYGCELVMTELEELHDQKNEHGMATGATAIADVHMLSQADAMIGTHGSTFTLLISEVFAARRAKEASERNEVSATAPFVLCDFHNHSKGNLPGCDSAIDLIRQHSNDLAPWYFLPAHGTMFRAELGKGAACHEN